MAILPAMTTIINTSLRSGQVPPSLKVAQIQPTLKKATLDPNEMSNYRPISNLSFLSKTLERIVGQQLAAYLTDKLIDEH